MERTFIFLQVMKEYRTLSTEAIFREMTVLANKTRQRTTVRNSVLAQLKVYEYKLDQLSTQDHCANKGLFGPLKHASNQAFYRTIFLHWKFGSTKWAF